MSFLDDLWQHYSGKKKTPPLATGLYDDKGNLQKYQEEMEEANAFYVAQMSQQPLWKVSQKYSYAPLYSGQQWFISDESFAKQPVCDPPKLPTRTSDTPFLAYRAWKVDTKSAQLLSLTQSVRWDGTILRSGKKPCPYDPHNDYWTDREDHHHGIYGHKEPCWEDFADTTGMWLTTIQPTPRAVGAIELTGTVVVHQSGYRAEMARILRLVLWPSLMKVKDLPQRLADRYECSVSFDPTTLEV